MASTIITKTVMVWAFMVIPRSNSARSAETEGLRAPPEALVGLRGDDTI
jgi:hypothetical protein